MHRFLNQKKSRRSPAWLAVVASFGYWPLLNFHGAGSSGNDFGIGSAALSTQQPLLHSVLSNHCCTQYAKSVALYSRRRLESRTAHRAHIEILVIVIGLTLGHDIPTRPLK